MIKNTLIVVGPGGIGKGPLAYALKDDLHQVDPYRLRTSGPRDKNDQFYCHPNFRKELYFSFAALDEPPVLLANGVEWFPRAMALLFRVRSDWQLLFLHGRDAEFGKAEIYAPVLPIILGYPIIAHVFGMLEMVVIHPGKHALGSTANWSAIKAQTMTNCINRGDSQASALARSNSVDEEAPAWQLLVTQGGFDGFDWPYPEYSYKPNGLTGSALLQHQISLLLQGKSWLVGKRPSLDRFFKTDSQIRAISQLIVP